MENVLQFWPLWSLGKYFLAALKLGHFTRSQINNISTHIFSIASPLPALSVQKFCGVHPLASPFPHFWMHVWQSGFFDQLKEMRIFYFCPQNGWEKSKPCRSHIHFLKTETCEKLTVLWGWYACSICVSSAWTFVALKSSVMNFQRVTAALFPFYGTNTD